MGAEFIDQPQAAGGVAERNQPFRQQFDPHRRAVVFG
jgi:hypothetical protein